MPYKLQKNANGDIVLNVEASGQPEYDYWVLMRHDVEKGTWVLEKHEKHKGKMTFHSILAQGSFSHCITIIVEVACKISGELQEDKEVA